MSVHESSRQVQAATRAIAAAEQALAAARELLTTAAPEPEDPYVRVTKHLRGLVPARVACAACTAGQIATATRPGKHWLARRSAVDAWLASGRPSTVADDGDAVLLSWERRAKGGQP